MAGLAFECLVRKQYRRLTEVACASAGMLVVSGAIYLIFVRPQVTTILTNDWNPNYMPTHSVPAAVTFLRRELVENLVPYLGFGSLAVDAALILAGIGALLWLRRFALALDVPGHAGAGRRGQRGPQVPVRGPADLHLLAGDRPAADGRRGSRGRVPRGPGRPPPAGRWWPRPGWPSGCR